MKRTLPLLLLAAMAAAQNRAETHPAIDPNDPAIGYSTLTLSDPVSALGRQIEQGKVRLEFDPATGYLPAVLQALGIPRGSQMAVFSKTSLQSLRIDPRNPRVLFFNDSTVVGWVRGGFLEIASLDPQQGMIFYLLDQRSPKVDQRSPMAGAPPVAGSPFIRHQDCLSCHLSSSTLGVPGALLRSVVPSTSGVPVNGSPRYDTDGRTPFNQLWGGWYVTGNTGPARHMGNLMVADREPPEALLKRAPVHLDSLDGRVIPGATLTPYSDIAALLVFEHQTRMMNLLIRANWESRISLAETHMLSAKAMAALGELAEGLLFRGEALLEGEIAGTSGFAQVFSAQGPRDSKGRSLRELSLRGRLMRYPCSYMIYNPAFDALPKEAKEVVYKRLWRMLLANPPAERAAIEEILRDTKPGLPAYFWL